MHAACSSGLGPNSASRKRSKTASSSSGFSGACDGNSCHLARQSFAAVDSYCSWVFEERSVRPLACSRSTAECNRVAGASGWDASWYAARWRDSAAVWMVFVVFMLVGLSCAMGTLLAVFFGVAPIPLLSAAVNLPHIFTASTKRYHLNSTYPPFSHGGLDKDCPIPKLFFAAAPLSPGCSDQRASQLKRTG